MLEKFKKFTRTGGDIPVSTKRIFSASFCSRNNYCCFTTLHTTWFPNHLVCLKVFVAIRQMK